MQKVSEKESKDYKDEIWKEIPNTNGIYFISNYGRLKSFRRDKEKGRIMKLSKVKQFHTANVKINGRYKSCLIPLLSKIVVSKKLCY